MHFSLLFYHPLTYGYVFVTILLNIYLIKFAICGYILLATHPPQWHNAICELPLIQNHSLRMDDSFSKAVEESIHFKDKDPSLGHLPRDLVMLKRKGRELIGTQITGFPIL